MELVPLLELADSPRLIPDNASNTCNIRKYACHTKKAVRICFYIVLDIFVS